MQKHCDEFTDKKAAVYHVRCNCIIINPIENVTDGHSTSGNK